LCLNMSGKCDVLIDRLSIKKKIDAALRPSTGVE